MSEPWMCVCESVRFCHVCSTLVFLEQGVCARPCTRSPVRHCWEKWRTSRRLGQLHVLDGWWRLYQCWGLFVSFSICFPSCMYEEYLHGLTRAITNGQTRVKHTPRPPPPLLLPLPSLCVSRRTSWLHSPVDTNPFVLVVSRVHLIFCRAHED